MFLPWLAVSIKTIAVAIPARRHKMSLMRQDLIKGFDPKPGVSIATLASD